MFKFFGRRPSGSDSPLTGSSPPPVLGKNIGATRLRYSLDSNEATTTRALASGGTTAAALGVGAYWASTAGLTTAHMAAGAAVGASVAVPVLMPALLGVMVACVFVMRQKGLNQELISNLYFIHMEVERMVRIHTVIKKISAENGINLNTASLAIIMDKLKDKILLFSDEKTKRDIKEFEAYLESGPEGVTKAQEMLATKMAETGKDISASVNQPSKKWFQKMLPTGLFSRWISPDETLRQIIRDITIAIVWFAIMLGEFDIFTKYMDIKKSSRESENRWVNSQEMQTLLEANKRLGETLHATHTNRSNSKLYDTFYNRVNIEALKEAGEGVSNATEPKHQNSAAAAAATEVSGATPVGNPHGGGITRRRKA
jgi:hypothetical protein